MITIHTTCQSAADRVDNLVSVPTLHRFKKQSIRQMSMELMNLMIDIFIDSFDDKPERLFLILIIQTTQFMPLSKLDEIRYFCRKITKNSIILRVLHALHCS